jgi:hypothetical protein
MGRIGQKYRTDRPNMTFIGNGRVDEKEEK